MKNKIFNKFVCDKKYLYRNLEELYEECHQATMRNEKVAAMVEGLCLPYERPLVLVWDATDVGLPKSGNHKVQKRTFSTKSNENCLHK